MRLEIYEEQKEEGVVRLKLREFSWNGDTAIELIAVDEHGERLEWGAILEITPNGTLNRYFGCSVKGIKTDRDGKIKLSE